MDVQNDDDDDLLYLFWISVKHSIRLLVREGSSCKSCSLQANDEQDKMHWLHCLQLARQNLQISDRTSIGRSSCGSQLSYRLSCREEPEGMEEANSSISSFSSLLSVFSVDSGIGHQQMSAVLRPVNKRDLDGDSGIFPQEF